MLNINRQPAPERTPPQISGEVMEIIKVMRGEKYAGLSDNERRDVKALFLATEIQMLFNKHWNARAVTVPEPAAQQECPIQGMDTCREIVSTVVNFMLTKGQLDSSAIHDEALLQKVGQLMPRTWNVQAEPAPTTSRAVRLFSMELVMAGLGQLTGYCKQIRSMGFVAEKVEAIIKREIGAEASALGTKEADEE